MKGVILALVENAVPDKNVDIELSGYFRLYGNTKIATLLQSSHSAVISNGSELEHYIEKNSKYKVCKVKVRTTQKNGTLLKNPKKLKDTIPTFEDVLYNCFEKVDSYFPKIRISKEELKKHIDYDLKSKKNIEVDGIWVINGEIFVAEYKDGFALDTKKSDSEINMLQILEEFFQNVPCSLYLVLWNLDNIKDHSIKSLEAAKYVITGREFSKIVNLDFDLINKSRDRYQKANEKYFITTALALNPVKGILEYIEGLGYKIEAPV